jgi:hypothetical protein
MTRTGVALLEFDPRLDLSAKKHLRDGLSAVVQVGHTLWVANDETVSLERLTSQRRTADADHRYGDHTHFSLHDYLRLPMSPPPDPNDSEEADLEGSDYCDGYLWIVGSHSVKRKKAEEDRPAAENVMRLAHVSRDGNRFLLARIPLVDEHGTYALKRTVERRGRRLVAAQLAGDDQGNELIEAVTQDPHLHSFLAIPGKENGFDIEGRAVMGRRLFIGLRGPVMRGWAVILEVEPEEHAADAATLHLKRIGPGGRLYRKHFLQLGGLGIRDLCVQRADLLILAGPTMDLDGSVTVVRWPMSAQPGEESLVFDQRLATVLEVPYGRGTTKGTDHAEGMTLFTTHGDEHRAVLVVYDSAANRRKRGNHGVEADIFALSPGGSSALPDGPASRQV